MWFWSCKLKTKTTNLCVVLVRVFLSYQILKNFFHKLYHYQGPIYKSSYHLIVFYPCHCELQSYFQILPIYGWYLQHSRFLLKEKNWTWRRSFATLGIVIINSLQSKNNEICITNLLPLTLRALSFVVLVVGVIGLLKNCLESHLIGESQLTCLVIHPNLLLSQDCCHFQCCYWEICRLDLLYCYYFYCLNFQRC